MCYGRLSSSSALFMAVFEGELGDAGFIDVAEAFGIEQEAFIFDVVLDALLPFAKAIRKAAPVSRFPAVERDLSLLVPEAVTYAQVEAAARKLALPYIRDYRPADFQPAGKMAAGAYSILLRITFQSEDRTLTGGEISEATRQVLSALEPLGVRVRGEESGKAAR